MAPNSYTLCRPATLAQAVIVVAGYSARRSGFDHSAVRPEFVAVTVVLGHVLLPTLEFFTVRILPPLLCIHISVRHSTVLCRIIKD